mgnify:FL=1
MNFQANLIKTLEVQKGQGSNGEWRKQTIVFETDGMYPKQIAVDMWNDKVDEVKNFKIGSKYDVHINIESREYNGRYFTNIRAWKIDEVGQFNSQNSSESATPPPVEFNNNDDDDLPF